MEVSLLDSDCGIMGKTTIQVTKLQSGIEEDYDILDPVGGKCLV